MLLFKCFSEPFLGWEYFFTDVRYPSCRSNKHTLPHNRLLMVEEGYSMIEVINVITADKEHTVR